MSTFAYAQLTNKREAAAPGSSSTTGSPGIKTYIDAFAALVPAEVLSLHALIISTTTKTVAGQASVAVAASAPTGAASAVSQGSAASGSAGTTTTFLPDGLPALQASFWILLVLSIALFVVPRYYGGKWDRYDWIRAAIAPLAFVGWTMLQRATAFDAVFPDVSPVVRTVAALILGAVLGGVTAALASLADNKDPSKP